MKLLVFSASWCPPCKTYKPVVEEFQQEFSVTKVDIDEEPEIAKDYGVQSIPTTILIDDEGYELKRLNGSQRIETLREFVMTAADEQIRRWKPVLDRLADE